MKKIVSFLSIFLIVGASGIFIPKLIQDYEGRVKPKARATSNTQTTQSPPPEHYSDPKKVLSLAEKFFIERRFTDSVKFYERYLVLVPDDNRVRAKLGSALTFTGDVNGAVAQLRFAKSKLPQDFQVLAFLSIAYAEGGDLKKALATGEEALKYAPHEEAKKRFSSLIDSLRSQVRGSQVRGGVEPASSSEPKTQSIQANSQQGLKMPDAESLQKADSREGLEAFLSSHPMVGQKFVGLDSDGDALKLKFKDFPMQSMPPFALKKFTDKVMLRVNKEKFAKVIFLDQSGNTMHEIATNYKN